MQRIKGVEELFLGLFLAFQELDVIDQQHVHIAITAEIGASVLTDRIDEVVGQFFSRDVAHSNPVEVVTDVVASACSRCVLPRPESP